MFGVAKKQQSGETLSVKINGMHCVSCSMNISGELEDLDGVHSAETDFAKSTTTITYDSTRVSIEAIHNTIKSLGYEVEDSL